VEGSGVYNGMSFLIVIFGLSAQTIRCIFASEIECKFGFGFVNFLNEFKCVFTANVVVVVVVCN